MIRAPGRRRLPYTRTVCASPSRTIGEWNEGKQGNGADGTDGAGCRTRTDDLPLTRRVLYLLAKPAGAAFCAVNGGPDLAGGCFWTGWGRGRGPPGAGGGGGGRGVSPPSSSPAPLPPSVTTNWTTRPAGAAGSAAGVAVSATATEPAEGMSDGGGGNAMPWPFSRA